MSRKTVAFSVPAPRAPEVRPESGRPAEIAPARTDAWVRERALIAPRRPDKTSPAAALRPADALLLDLAAERTLADVLFLSFFAPWALGWFWLAQALAGKPRF